MFVDTRKGNRRLILVDCALEFLDLRRHSLRQYKLDRVRISEREDDRATTQIRLVTDAYDIHLHCIAFGYSRDRIGHQSARGSMQSDQFFAPSLSDQLVLLKLKGDTLGYLRN